MHATWYFDVVSPYAYLALDGIEDLSRSIPIVYKPVLFAGILKHHGQLGPAEIPSKRLHTYRLCVFEAQRRGVHLTFPPAHPFNPVRALRFLCDTGAEPQLARRVMEHIWRDGYDPNEEGPWQQLTDRFKPGAAAPTDEISARGMNLRVNTEEAIAVGVFGVPTLSIGRELFWGVDALPMVRAYLDDPEIFERGEMARVATIENPFPPSR
ncbi:2-hydroxychromene-2-carboxylate isomerase, partial [Pararhodobacter sp. SW119]|uniref:2-hydroxychromene-2-carboxylate isomerase n=1 Tax=Pararhodobacter sp. SW119 TaxID=2780075 RepID=UPI001ADFEACD